MGSAAFFRRQRARFRVSVARLAVALSFAILTACSSQAGDEISELIEQSRRDFKPVNEGQAAEARSEVLARMKDVEAFVGQSNENGRHWFLYLRWSSLKEAVAADHPKTLEPFDATLRQLNRHEEGLEDQRFRHLARALKRYRDLVAISSWDRPAEIYGKQLDALQRDIEAFRKEPSAGNRAALADRLRILIAVGQADALVEAVRKECGRPNVLFTLSMKPAGQRLFMPIDRATPDLHVTGWLSLAPASPGGNKAAVLFRGWSYVPGDIAARRPLIGINIVELSADGAKVLSTEVRSGAPNKLQDEQTSKLLRELVDENSQRMQADYLERFRAPLKRIGAFPPIDIRCGRRDIIAEALFSDESKLGASGAPPAITPGHDFVVRLHESAVASYCGALFGGATFSQDQPDAPIKCNVALDWENGVLGLPTSLSDASAASGNLRSSQRPKRRPLAARIRRDAVAKRAINEPFKETQLTVREGVPVSANFAQSKISITVHAAEIGSGDKKFNDWDISGQYDQLLHDGQVVLSRRATLGLLPTNFRGQLNMRQVGERRNLETEVNKRSDEGRGFPKQLSIDLESLVLPFAADHELKMDLHEISSGDGWVTLYWDADPDPPKIVLEKRYRRSDPPPVENANDQQANGELVQHIEKYKQLAKQSDELLLNGKTDDGLSMWQQAAGIHRELLQRATGNRPDLAAARWLAMQALEARNGADAAAIMSATARSAAKTWGENSRQVAVAKNLGAECAFFRDNAKKAMLGESDALLIKAADYRRLGQLPEGIRCASDAIQKRLEVLGERHPGYALAMLELGALQSDAGHPAEAEVSFRTAYNIDREIVAVDDPDLCLIRERLADAQSHLGENIAEVPLRLEILLSLERRLKENDPRIIDARLAKLRAEKLASLLPGQRQQVVKARAAYQQIAALASLRRYDEAAKVAKQSAKTYAELLGADGPDYAASLLCLAELQCAANDYSEAIRLYNDATARIEKHYGRIHPQHALALDGLASALERAGKYADATAVRTNLEALYRSLYGGGSWQVREANYSAGRDQMLSTLSPALIQQVNSLAESRAKVETMLLRKDYQHAQKVAETALNTSQRIFGDKSRDYAQCLMDVALVESSSGLISEPADRIATVQQILEEQFGKKSPELCPALQAAGTYYVRVNRVAEANAVETAAVQLALEAYGPDDSRYAHILSGRAQQLCEAGQFADAESPMRQATAIYRRGFGEAHPEFARSIETLTEYLSTRSEYAEALSVSTDATRASRNTFGATSPEYAKALLQLALVSKKLRKLDDARRLFGEYLSITTDRYSRSRAVQQLAELEFTDGSPARAEQLARDAVKVFNAPDRDSNRDYADALCTLGKVLSNRKDLSEAGATLNRALVIYEKVGQNSDISRAQCLQALAHIYAKQRDLHSADDALSRAAGIYKSIHPEHVEYARCLDEQANLHVQSGLYSDIVRDNLNIARRILRWHTAQNLQALSEPAQIDFLQNEFVPSLHRALAVALTTTPPHEPSVREQQSIDPALVEMSASWVINGKSVAQQVLAERAQQSCAIGDSECAGRQEDLAAVRGQIARLTNELASGNALPGIHSQLKEAGQRQIGLINELAKSGGRKSGDPWVELEDIKAQLPKKTVLIELFRCRINDAINEDSAARYVAWLISQTDGVEIVDLGPAEEIDETIAEFQSANSPNVVRRRAVHDQLAQLGKYLIAPLEPKLQPFDRWIISPDGPLWLVPWAALPVGKAQYAVEHHRISYVVTGRDLVRRETAPPDFPSLVIGDPDFDLNIATSAESIRTTAKGIQSTATGSKWVRLPGTAVEADEAVRQLRHFLIRTPSVVNAFVGPRATKSAFTSALEPRFLVLCTHAYYRSSDVLASNHDNSVLQADAWNANPLSRCGLVLAGANRPRHTNDGGDDGILTGLEIVGSNLRGTELVVLSACDTGLGDIRDGEGVAGLRQAFHLAGANTTIATLWKIPDTKTVDLMQRFWTHMIPEKNEDIGSNKADALCEAQCDMIQRLRADNSDPNDIFWAAFALTGQTKFPERKLVPRDK